MFSEDNEVGLVRDIISAKIMRRPSKKNAECFTRLLQKLSSNTGLGYGYKEAMLIQLHLNNAKHSMVIMDAITNEQDEPLHIYLPESKMDFLNLIKRFWKRSQDYVGLNIGFSESRPYYDLFPREKPDFWWCLREGVMWSFDRKFMKNLPDYINSCNPNESAVIKSSQIVWANPD